MLLSITSYRGFTLAELLIALLIIGEIATFTIPKVITAQQNLQNTSKMKDTAAMVSAAYQEAVLNGAVTINTRLQDLTPYFNYISVDTSSTIDDIVGYGSQNCAGGFPCYRLHSGALLLDRASFAGTGTTNAMLMHLDLDGTYSGSTTGTGKSVMLVLFYNGRIASRGQLSTGVTSSQGTWGTEPNGDPSWATW